MLQRWAVDLNEHAINSLKLNHPETEVDLSHFLFFFFFWLVLKLCIRIELTE